jgi:hypothetical protein
MLGGPIRRTWSRIEKAVASSRVCPCRLWRGAWLSGWRSSAAPDSALPSGRPPATTTNGLARPTESLTPSCRRRLRAVPIRLLVDLRQVADGWLAEPGWPVGHKTEHRCQYEATERDPNGPSFEPWKLADVLEREGQQRQYERAQEGGGAQHRNPPPLEAVLPGSLLGECLPY